MNVPTGKQGPAGLAMMVAAAMVGCSQIASEDWWPDVDDPLSIVNGTEDGAQDISATTTLMSDQELFAAINLDLPEMSRVKRAVDRGAYSHAKRELATWLRNRTSVPYSFDPHTVDRNVEHSKGAADRSADGIVTLVGHTHAFPQGDIDWRFNATQDNPAVSFTQEWQWQLNRMYFWPNLGDTYWATGDEKYAQAWVRQLRKWASQAGAAPESASKGHPSLWRSIEAGNRMSYFWPWTYHRFLHSPSFTDEDVILYLKACIEHGRYHRRVQGPGNWLAQEMNGLFTLAALFPELKEAGQWRRFALDKMYNLVGSQFLPDGMHNEFSAMYQAIAMGDIRDVMSKAAFYNHQDELPVDMLSNLENAYVSRMYMCAPDRSLPRFNDTGGASASNHLAQGNNLFGRSDFLWVKEYGRRGTPAEFTSYQFPWAGFYTMRSSWDEDANFLVFDAGPLGAMHEHQDMLSVLLWAYGRELIADGGGGKYTYDQWRGYGIDTYSHNTALVDGKPQRRPKTAAHRVSKQQINARWQSNAHHDYAQGTYDWGYGSVNSEPAKHTRRVFFLKPDIFLVVDQFDSKDGHAHDYEVRWHLKSTSTAVESGTNTVVTTDANRPNLAIVPLRTDGLTVRAVSGQTSPELLGWLIDKGGHEKATTVQHRLRGVSGSVASLLLPLRSGRSHPVTRIEGSGDLLYVRFQEGRTLIVENATNVDKQLTAYWEGTPSPLDNKIPNVSFVVPQDRVPAGQGLYVKADASDPDGRIASVKLYVNAKIVREERIAPYEWGLPDQPDSILRALSKGTYLLKVVCTDDEGTTAEASRAVRIE